MTLGSHSCQAHSLKTFRPGTKVSFLKVDLDRPLFSPIVLSSYQSSLFCGDCSQSIPGNWKRTTRQMAPSVFPGASSSSTWRRKRLRGWGASRRKINPITCTESPFGVRVYPEVTAASPVSRSVLKTGRRLPAAFREKRNTHVQVRCDMPGPGFLTHTLG